MTERAPRRVPAVTLVLLTANLLAAGALTAYPDLAYTLGFRPDAPSGRAAVTSLFLHANLVHLLGNMLFLAAVGASVEMATGSVRFALVYFVSGLFGVVAHYAMTRTLDRPEPYVGASGAIAGCAAYYTVRYASLRVSVAPGLTASLVGVTVLWVVLQIAGAFVRLGESGGSSFWAHLGGFATGIVLCLIFRSPDLAQAEMSRERVRSAADRGPAAVAEMARRHLREHPDDLGALAELASAQQDIGDDEAETASRLLLAKRLPDAERGPAWVRLLALGAVAAIPPARRLAEADRIARHDPETARALLTTIAEDDARRPDALLALAALDRKADPEASASAVARLLEDHPMSSAAETARSRGWAP